MVALPYAMDLSESSRFQRNWVTCCLSSTARRRRLMVFSYWYVTCEPSAYCLLVGRPCTSVSHVVVWPIGSVRLLSCPQRHQSKRVTRPNGSVRFFTCPTLSYSKNVCRPARSRNVTIS